MHDRYGKCNSVYVKFRRSAEQGVWDALLQTLVDLGLTDDWQHMIDSTSVRGHVSAAGRKGEAFANALGRSRGGFTSKLRVRSDNHGLLEKPSNTLKNSDLTTPTAGICVAVSQVGARPGSFPTFRLELGLELKSKRLDIITA
jgi:hypothetical protein